MRPKVNLRKRLVYLFIKGLEMHEVYKLNRKGKLGPRSKPLWSFEPAYGEAMKLMGTNYHGWEPVRGMDHMKEPYRKMNATEYVELVWAKASGK